jgi:hypothetical protein
MRHNGRADRISPTKHGYVIRPVRRTRKGVAARRVSRRHEPQTVSVAVDGPQSHVIVAPAVQATTPSAVRKQADRVFSRDSACVIAHEGAPPLRPRTVRRRTRRQISTYRPRRYVDAQLHEQLRGNPLLAPRSIRRRHLRSRATSSFDCRGYADRRATPLRQSFRTRRDQGSL